MKVAVIGAGYVGLVQSAGLAHLGHEVALSDVNDERIDALRRGDTPIYELGLEDLLHRADANGLLSLHTDNLEAVIGARAVFLALPTPQTATGHADLSFIEGAVDQLAPALGPGGVIVTKSTVPVGTARRLQRRIDGLGSTVRMVSNPEFLREGSAVDDFLHAERVVIGADDWDAGDLVESLYGGLDTTIVRTDPSSAELIKYASNAYLATRLTFANSIANLAEEVGADIADVMLGMGLDRRIGRHFLQPGPGYGGSCFPKDTAALVALSEEADFDFRLVRTVIEVNAQQRERIVERLRRIVGGSLEGIRVGMWGLAFKAGTDDVRESPALDLGRRLVAAGAKVVAHDPAATTDELSMADDPLDALDDADLLLVATEWPEYLRIPLTEVADRMRGRAVYDARNLLDAAEVRAAGFEYHALGRPSA
jgi:UDPglucose 6-dehydrogenase